MKNKFRVETNSFILHVMAMVFMLCDHLWGTIVPGNDWLTCIGRITFPIYAFMIVEGYFNTKDFKKYFKRLIFFAVISEIPFNLVMGSSIIYPVHQNTLWSFIISLGLIHINETAKSTGKTWKRLLTGVFTVITGSLIGIIAFIDYIHAGILTVFVFYFFRGKKWWNYLGQLVCLWYINVEILSGFAYEVIIFGKTYYIVRQIFALLALIPIWLYNGKKGHSSKAFQYFCYVFYPVHLLILGILKIL